MVYLIAEGISFGSIFQKSLSRLFNSCFYNYPTVVGMISQQSLHDSSTVASMVFQQSLAQLFNSQDNHSFFLYWYDSAAVAFTVKESCHMLEIQQMFHIHLSR